MRIYDLVVIGGGSAGMAAAISAYDNGIRDILILEKEAFLGGILNQCIHSGFGLEIFKEELTGPEYAERFANEVKKRKIVFKLETFVLDVNKDKEIVYTNLNEGYIKIKAKSIIFAIGCKERTRGEIMLPGDRTYGVLTAGLAQKYLNIDGLLVGKKVFILGSGDIGLIMARRMTLEGAEVLGVAEIMPYSNGLNRNIVQCLNDFNIPLYLSHTVTNVIGKDRIEEIEISQVDENLKIIPNTNKRFEVDTLLLSVGLIPDTKFFKNLDIEINPRTKSALVNEDYETNIPGIFCCGNNLHVHDLVDFVTKEGYETGLGVSKYLKNNNEKENYIETRALNNISYILPNKINISNIEEIVFKSRVKRPLDNKKIIIKLNDKIIKEIKKNYLLPAEMIEIKIKKSDFIAEKGFLTFEVEE